MAGLADLARDRAGTRGVPVERLVAIVVGVLAGLAALGMQGLETRWIVIPVLGLAGAIFVYILPNKEWWLSIGFILSLQANLSIRFGYGRAGSDGLVFPLTIVIGAALAGWWWWHGEFRSRYRWTWKGVLSTPIFFYLGTTAASIVLTDERFVGFSSLMFDLQLWFVYLLTLNAIHSQEDGERTVRLLLIALGMQSLVYFIQSAMGVTFTLTGDVIEAGELPRPGGTISTVPAEFASFVIPILMIAISYFLTKGRILHRGLLAALVGGGAMAIALTYTRAAWAGLVLGGAWVVVIGYRRRLLRPQALTYVAVLGLAAVLVIVPLAIKRFDQSPLDDSYSERAALMTMAYRIIRAEPVLGVGAGAYGQVYRRYLTAEDEDQWLWIVHNRYLLRTAETGIPGGIALVLLFLSALRVALRLTRSRDPAISSLALGISAGIVSMLWEMYWDTFRGFAYNALLWMLFALLAALWQLERDRARDGELVPIEQ